MKAHLGGGGSGAADGQDEFLAPMRGGMNVALNEIVERLTQRSPVMVMVRRTLEYLPASEKREAQGAERLLNWMGLSLQAS
jgi:hypothetical protein